MSTYTIIYRTNEGLFEALVDAYDGEDAQELFYSNYRGCRIVKVELTVSCE